MVMHSDEYRDFIVQLGVGRKDKVASSPDSYMGYLRSVSRLIGKDVSPGLILAEKEIDSIMEELKGQKKIKTLNNYRTALNRYLEFVLYYQRREK